MKPFDRMEKEILTALLQAEKQGQPIAALFEAVAEGAELDAWFEPQDDGREVLVIAVRD